MLVSCPEDPVSPPKIDILIESVSPTPLKFLNRLTIKGKNFDSTFKNSSLMINDRAVDTTYFRLWNDSTIHFYLPEWATNGYLYVKRGNDISNKYPVEILDYPVILDVEPSFGFPGDTAYINGRFLGKNKSDSSNLLINDKSLQPIFWNDTLIYFIVPKLNDKYDAMPVFKVTKGLQTSNFYSFYKILNYPKINKVYPEIVTIQSNVTIEGTNFKLYNEYIGGENPELFINDMKITDISNFSHEKIIFKIPKDAVSGYIITKRFGRKSNPMPITITGHPEIFSINPDEATRGIEIKINGRNFSIIQGNVYFGLVKSDIISWNDTEIRCKVPNIDYCTNLHIEINGLKSNDILFKYPNCKLLSDFNIKNVDVQSHLGNFMDTLKYENGTYKFKFRNNPYQEEANYSLVLVEFDTKTLNIKKGVIEYKFVEVGGNGIIGHYKVTLVRIIAQQIPFSSISDNTLDYIISNKFADRITINYEITGSWSNSKTGETGKYDEKGTYDPANMSSFTFHFY
jgi:hypothetical protein